MKRIGIMGGAIAGLVTAGVVAGCGVQLGAAQTPTPARTSTTTPTTTTAPKTTVSVSTQTVVVEPAPTRTVYVQPPVYVAPTYSTPAQDQWYAQVSYIDSQPWIEIDPNAGQTDCQWLYANGYTYAEAFAAWAQRGYPANWSATNDGYPCQRTYGMQH